MQSAMMVSDAAWGSRPISIEEAEAFGMSLAVSGPDRANVVRTLYEFQPDGMVRGMFFTSLRATLVKSLGEDVAKGLLVQHRIGDRFIPFSLYPHRDFYRFWFAAIPKAFPGRSVAHGIERIAEIYFPTFLDSAAGRTMAALLLGSDPLTIVRRLRDAYAMSVPHNKHKLEELSSTHVRWDAIVEPSPYYEQAFVGIMRGAMGCQRAPMPTVTKEVKGSFGKHHQRLVFDLRWG